MIIQDEEVYRLIFLLLQDHTDASLRADPKKPNLLHEGTTVHHLSPFLGTEIKGVQLSQLSKEGLNELALYTAERKVLVFRDQDFKDIGPDRQIEIARLVTQIWIEICRGSNPGFLLYTRHFGPIQRHPTSGNVKGYPEFHVGMWIIFIVILITDASECSLQGCGT